MHAVHDAKSEYQIGLVPNDCQTQLRVAASIDIRNARMYIFTYVCTASELSASTLPSLLSSVILK